jgi:hypothetical protein
VHTCDQNFEPLHTGLCQPYMKSSPAYTCRAQLRCCENANDSIRLLCNRIELSTSARSLFAFSLCDNANDSLSASSTTPGTGTEPFTLQLQTLHQCKNAPASTTDVSCTLFVNTVIPLPNRLLGQNVAICRPVNAALCGVRTSLIALVILVVTPRLLGQKVAICRPVNA